MGLDTRLQGQSNNFPKRFSRAALRTAIRRARLQPLVEHPLPQNVLNGNRQDYVRYANRIARQYGLDVDLAVLSIRGELTLLIALASEVVAQ